MNNTSSTDISLNQIFEILKKGFGLIKIHRPVLLIAAIGLFIISINLFSSSINLVLHGLRTTGSIGSIEPTYTTCGKKHEPCTEFRVNIEFYTLSGTKIHFTNRYVDTVNLDHAQITDYRRQVGDIVNIIYLPTNPLEQSFEDTFLEIWLMPIVLMFMHLATFFGAFSKGRR